MQNNTVDIEKNNSSKNNPKKANSNEIKKKIPIYIKNTVYKL